MRRFAMAVMLAMALMSTACHSITADAGEEVVLVKKPIIFGSGGVDQTPVKTGQVWAALTTSGVPVNMQPKTYSVDFNDLMSSDGVPLDFHAMIRLRVTNSVGLVTNFGTAWFNNNIAPKFNSYVRDAVKRHGMNETAISTEAIEAIDSAVTASLSEYITSIKIPVELLDMTVGRANPPDAVKNQRMETAAQEQRINTEAKRKLAEDARRASEISRAAADNAYREAMRLSPDQFLALEAIKTQAAVCGNGNCTFVFPGTVSGINIKR